MQQQNDDRQDGADPSSVTAPIRGSAARPV
jgi:hypothetical protein